MKTKRILLILLGAAILLRIAVIFIFKTYDHPFFLEYEDIARNMLSGKGFVYEFLNTPYRSFCNPLYGWITVVVYAVTGHSYLAMILVQSFASLALAYVVFRIAATIFDEKTGILSAALVLFHPGFVYYDCFKLIPLSIDSLFIALIALFFIKGKDDPGILNMFMVGALIGLGALSRGIIGSFMPFLCLYILIFSKGVPARNRMVSAASLALATFLVIAPWVVRNYVIHKKIMIVSTTGETFWRGNNKYALGTSLSKDGRSIIELWPVEFRNKVYALDEMGQKKFFEKEAVDYIRRNPMSFLRLYAKKVYYFWWFSPQSGAIYPKAYLLIYKSLYSVLLSFSILGLGLSFFSRNEQIRKNTWAIAFIFMSVFVTQSFFYVEGRHRWLIEPILIIFFSYGIWKTYGFARQKLARAL